MKCKQLLFILPLLLLASCGSPSSTPSNSENNSTNNNSTIKEPVDVTYSATCHYVFCDVELSSNTFSIKKSQLTQENLEKELVLPSEYVLANSNLNNCLKSEFDYKNNKIDYTVTVKPQYEGYMEIKSSDASANNKIVPVSVLTNFGKDMVSTTTDFYGSPVTYQPSHITEIKFKNCKNLSFGFYVDDFNYSKFSSLTKLDVSELEFVEKVPKNFFAYCENLHDVVWGNAFKYTKRIGSAFFEGTQLNTCNLNLANVTEIGNTFLFNSLTNLSSNAVVKFNEVKSFSDCMLYQHTMKAGTKVSVYFGKSLPNSCSFKSIGSDGYTYYPANMTGLKPTTWTYRTQGTFDFYSDYPDQIQTYATDYAEDGATINVYHS